MGQRRLGEFDMDEMEEGTAVAEGLVGNDNKVKSIAKRRVATLSARSRKQTIEKLFKKIISFIIENYLPNCKPTIACQLVPSPMRKLV